MPCSIVQQCDITLSLFSQEGLRSTNPFYKWVYNIESVKEAVSSLYDFYMVSFWGMSLNSFFFRFSPPFWKKKKKKEIISSYSDHVHQKCTSDNSNYKISCPLYLTWQMQWYSQVSTFKVYYQFISLYKFLVTWVF